jgi:tight adherence protein C
MLGILVILIIITTIVLLVSIFFSIRHYVFVKQRLDRIIMPFLSASRKGARRKDDVIVKAYLFVAKSVLQRFNMLTKDTVKAHTKRVANAGFLSKNALIVYLSTQLLSVLFFALFGVLLTIVWPKAHAWPFYMRGALVLFMAWFGYRLPDFVLNQLAKRYRTLLRNSILDFFDLFLICVEAGFGNDKALERVSAELAAIHPALSEQMRVLIVELRILPSRYAAWENLAERTGLTEITTITQIIKQSELLGTSVAQALRTQIDMFRSERLGRVEQKAMRLPTLLTLPLVLFIFPALMLVILGPAIIRATQIFHS